MFLHSNHKLKKLISFYQPYRKLFAADIICAVFSAVSALGIPLCTRYITNYILTETAPDAKIRILQTGLVIAGLILVHFLTSLFKDYMGHVLGAKMERDMRNELFAHYQKLPVKYFDNHNTGELLSRVNSDLLNLAEMYHHLPEDLLVYTVSFFGAFFILLRVNLSLSLLICTVLPVMLLYAFYFHRKLKQAYRESYEAIAEVNAQTEDSLSNIRITKSFVREDLENKKFKAANDIYFRSRSNIYRHEAFYFTGMENLFLPVMTAAIVVLGGAWITTGAFHLGDFITFLMYVGYLTMPIPKIAFSAQQYQEGMAAFHRFMEIIQTVPEPETGILLSRPVRGAFQFEHVSFRYQEEGTNVFHDLSLSVRAGERVAIVGRSGAGKTTLCSLLYRFYQPDFGNIYLDGFKLQDLNLYDLREQIGVVFQEVYLFSGTVLDNILYGHQGASFEDVAEAAKRAHAHDFIMQLPEQYATKIGQHGIKLSGGQRQRLSIARVFLKNPPVLVFDEATSSLDNSSEEIIHKALSELSRNRTTFVIAHRLSTIRNAQRILVMGEQGIEAQGSHEELMQKNETYAALYGIENGDPVSGVPSQDS